MENPIKQQSLNAAKSAYAEALVNYICATGDNLEDHIIDLVHYIHLLTKEALNENN